MEQVEIGFSKWRFGAALILMACFALHPILIAIYMPELYWLNNKTIDEIILVIGVSGSMSLMGVVVFFWVGIALINAKAAIVLSTEGILTNVSGWSTRFYPWEDVVKAKCFEESNISPNRIGKKIIIVSLELVKNDSKKSELFRRHSDCKLRYTFLDIHGHALANMINEYIDKRNTYISNTDTNVHTLQNYVNKAA